MSKHDITFWGDVEQGKLKLHDKEAFLDYVSSLDGLVSVNVKKRRKKRTSPQNNLYWKWVTIIAGELGYEPMEMHDTFKYLYNSEIKMLESGKELKIVKSTTRLNIVEFIEYMNMVERYAAELNIALPQPEQL